MEQDGRGDVVRQVAHHPDFGLGYRRGLGQHLRRQSPEVDFEHIRLDHRQVRVLAQAHRQVAVQLDDRQVTQTLDQRLRQRGQARPNFDHGLARFGVDRIHDGIDDAAVGQKVLTKPFACDVFHWGGSRIST